MRRLILLLIIAVITSGFSFKSELSVTGSRKYKSVELTPDIYGSSRSDLGDLRIYDDEGLEIPYFIYNIESFGYTDDITREMTLVDDFVNKNDLNMDFRISGLRENEDVLSSGIKLFIPAYDFAKQINIYGSHDGIKWTEIVAGTVYNVDLGYSNRLNFGTSVKYTWFRIKIINNTENLRIESAEAVYQNWTMETNIYRAFPAEYEIVSRDKKTEIAISNARNLRLKSIRLDTDNIFERTIVIDRPYTVYNLEFSGVSLKKTEIDLNGKSFDDLKLVIEDKDNRPINIKGIELEYFPDRLVFAAVQENKYYLHYGNPELTVPEYDIINYKSYIIDEGFDACDILEAEELERRIQILDDYTWVLNAAVILVGISLMMYIIFIIKKKG